MRALAAASVLLALLTTPAVSSHAQTQQEMNAQAAQSFATADAALNRVYARVIAKVSPQGQAALRNAQRAWLQFRDQECAFEALGSRDGSIHPLVVNGCKQRLTEQRTTMLRAQLDCQEGDVACGGQ